MEKALSVVLFFLCLVCQAQPDFEWFEIGTSWTYNWNGVADPDQEDFTYVYEVTENTIFLDQPCRKVEAFDGFFGCLVNYPPYYFYQSGDTIYYATEEMSAFAIGYILSEGAEWTYSANVDETESTFQVTVIEETTTMINGNPVPSFVLNYEETTQGFVDIFPAQRTIVEGLGDLEMFIIPFGLIGFCDFEIQVLLRCFNSASLNYLNPEFDSCTLGLGDDVQISSRTFYPQPTQGQIYWDSQIESIAIYDYSGSLVLQNPQTTNIQSFSLINLNPGFYTIVYEKNNLIFSEKLIVVR